MVAGVDLVRREALVLVALGNIGEREYEAGVCVWVVTLDSNLKDGSLCERQHVMVPNVCFIFSSTLESQLD